MLVSELNFAKTWVEIHENTDNYIPVHVNMW